MNADVIGGTVRTMIAALGGMAVAVGLITPDESGALIAALGAVANAMVLLWSLWDKFKQRKVVQTALMTPPPAQPLDGYRVRGD